MGWASGVSDRRLEARDGDGNVFMSAEGCAQGDPLGQFLFAIGYFSCKLVDAGRKSRLLPSGPWANALSRANTRAAGPSHALLHAHRVKTARTPPRARKHTRSGQKPVSCA